MTPEQLKKWRISHKMTQKQAAEYVGVKTLQWYRWEAGRAAIPQYVAVIVDLLHQISPDPQAA